MKEKTNYKYLNLLLILAIVYLLFLMRSLWIGVLTKIIAIILPFIIAFSISYILYPFLKFLMSKKIPKAISIIIIMSVILLIVGLTIYYVVPLFFNQLVNLLSSLGKISTDLASKYNIDTKVINDTINMYLLVSFYLVVHLFLY